MKLAHHNKGSRIENVINIYILTQKNLQKVKANVILESSENGGLTGMWSSCLKLTLRKEEFLAEVHVVGPQFSFRKS